MEKKASTVRSKEEVNQILSEWEQSKLSKKEFCLQKQINYQTFIGWIVQSRSRSKASENKFVPVQVDSTSYAGIFAEITLSTTKKVILRQPVSAEFFQAILKC